MGNNDDNKENYAVGDRIVLFGLERASHLNGRHGHIGSLPPNKDGRYTVNLDLLDPSTPRPLVKAKNIKRESTNIITTNEPRAGASHGCIEEKYGRPLNLIWDAIRFIAATEFLEQPDVNDMRDIERMRWAEDSRQNARLNQFLSIAWSHWTDGGTFRTPSMYEMAKKWAQEQIKTDYDKMKSNEQEFVNIISDAFDHQTAAKSWNVRIHGQFWVVGSDDEGTFLIPKVNPDIVYQCVGLTSNMHDLMRQAFGDEPVLVTCTCIPFYGRLVYDGIVAPVQVVPGMMMYSGDLEWARMQVKVDEAKRHGRVVKSLRQLEVKGGSLEGLPTQGSAKIDRTPKFQSPPTAKEVELVNKLKGITNTYDDGDRNGIWVFRRFGYTEQDNPQHKGIVLSEGTALGVFYCERGLAPTATDILQSTVNIATGINKRPRVILPDDYACHERVKFLLKDVTKVDYYHPATPEETAAAVAGPPY